MTDPLKTIKDEMWEQITLNYPKSVPAELRAKLEAEIADASSLDAIGARGKQLNTLYGFWKLAKAKGKKGDKNVSNSWLAYALGMTDVMPAGATLPERRAFARAGFPDIDSDFEDERREEVIQDIKLEHGDEYVANVGTYGKLNMKSYLRRAVKALDCAKAFKRGKDQYKTLNKLLGDEIIATLPKPQGAKIIWTDDEGKNHDIKTVKDAYQWVPEFKKYMDRYPEIMQHAEHLEGATGEFGTHASGIIVSNVPLSEIAPVRPVKKKNWLGDVVQSWSTQYAYEDCETLGLIKFDVLAIKMLSTIKHTLKLIKQKWDIDIDIENIPLDDKEAFRLFRNGNLVGVFQCEGYGMQKTCKEIAPDRFEDIVAAIALYRPGPIASIPEYVARKHGRKPVTYFHPSIEPYVKDILEPTYGILCYQEQVMYLCNRLAGMSMADAYQVIKAIGKKLMDLILQYGDMFVAGCMAKGIPEEVAREFWGGVHDNGKGKSWGFIVPFADYGFNKSHSLCYGNNAYITAKLKARFPEEYLCASLNVEAMRKKWDKVTTLERDCRDRNNITIGRRTINTCGMDYVIMDWSKEKGRGLIQPPILCQGLSYGAAEEIVREREIRGPYKDMRDFATRTASVVDTSSVQSLADAGFFAKGKGEANVKEFEAIRKDLKNADRRGVESQDMFEGL